MDGTDRITFLISGTSVRTVCLRLELNLGERSDILLEPSDWIDDIVLDPPENHRSCFSDTSIAFLEKRDFSAMLATLSQDILARDQTSTQISL